jgi:hypothetical protein
MVAIGAPLSSHIGDVVILVKQPRFKKRLKLIITIPFIDCFEFEIEKRG